MTEISKSNYAEVIDLLSDEEIEKNDHRKKSSKAHNNSCINYQCNSGLDMMITPSFSRYFYNIHTTRKKRRLICKKCFNVSFEHQQQLALELLERRPLLNCEFPNHTMHIEISDSDDSDNEQKIGTKENNKFLSNDLLLNIIKYFDNNLDYAMKKYHIDYQIEEACKILTNKWNKIIEEDNQLNNCIKNTMKDVDSLRQKYYDRYKPQIIMLNELQIDDTINDNNIEPPAIIETSCIEKSTQVDVSPCTQLENSQQEPEQVMGDINQKVVSNLFRNEPVVIPVPEVGSIVYIMKHPLMSWLKAKVHAIASENPLPYQVELLQEKYNNVFKFVNGKQIAVAVTSKFIIPVSTRVVAAFHDRTFKNFYSGIIAEPPKVMNKHRYLVFFDNGYAQYVQSKCIYLIYKSSLKVWKDVPIESQDFVKKYIQSYPERPMVKFQIGQIVKTEWNNKWWLTKVVKVDASLVLVHYYSDRRIEWIYRGSARLWPLYLELLKAVTCQRGHHAPISTVSHYQLPDKTNGINLPYVEYTSIKIEDDDENDKPLTSNLENTIISESLNITNNASQPRAVAKKSTSKKPNLKTIHFNANKESKVSNGVVHYQLVNKIQTKKFETHKCGPHCIQSIFITSDDLKGYSPLSIPLLCGWNRQTCTSCKDNEVILYQAPCGVRLRNMEEVLKYVNVTGSSMSLDLFNFNPSINCLTEFTVDKCFINIKDYSYGVENIPVPCINELDTDLPDLIQYTTHKEPMKDVNINLDPNFLCCCDCEDDCQDKTKCQCWQLTIQGAALQGQVPNESIGYAYKRLPEPVLSGIYECNSGCKCSVKTCLNRVVQHPVNLKLQVFKTVTRGWGVRCLNDIPLGTFICIYAGKLLTEQGINEDCKNFSDEYLAELDYIEIVEGIKEDYESDVLEPQMPLTTNSFNNKRYSKSYNDKTSENFVNNSNDDFDSNENFNGNFTNNKQKNFNKSRYQKRKSNRKSKKKNYQEEYESPKSKKLRKNVYSNGTLNEINNDDDEIRNGRQQLSRFNPTVESLQVDRLRFKSARSFFGADEIPYIMDAKFIGNVGRFFNHSCDPNIFVQNVFVDTYDVRFPWVAFFALKNIKAGEELMWNYNYVVGSVPGKVILCRCGASNCRGRLL